MAVKRKEWTVVAMLEWATDFFQRKGVPDPRYSIEWLLADVLEMKRLDLYLYFDRPLSKEELDALRPLFKRRARHEPLQYITGHTDFLNARLTVTPDVLIPRSETEQLTEHILENHSGEESLSLLDVGTGSGCIAIALKMERNDWHITALDVSKEALTVAKKNAAANQADVKLLEFDIFKDDISTVAPCDIIVSNPPYILPEEKDTLEPQVVKYEPRQALFCGDIQAMYKQIEQLSGSVLNNRGSLYLEIHSRQKEEISRVFNERKWDIKFIHDYERAPRFIHAKKRNG